MYSCFGCVRKQNQAVEAHGTSRLKILIAAYAKRKASELVSPASRHEFKFQDIVKRLHNLLINMKVRVLKWPLHVPAAHGNLFFTCARISRSGRPARE